MMEANLSAPLSEKSTQSQILKARQKIIAGHENNDELPQVLAAMRPYTQEDRAKSWSLTLVTLVLLVGAFYFTTPSHHFALRIGASILSGLMMMRVFILYHDYLHGAILRDSKIAEGIMFVVGTLFLRPPVEWKRSHNFHHQHNAQFKNAAIGSFPIKTVKEYLALTEKQKLQYRIIRHPLVIVFGYVTCFALESVKKIFFKDRALRLQSLLAAGTHAAIIYWAATTGWSSLVLSVFIPYLMACGLGTYLFYVQHNFEGALFKPDEEWDFAFACLNSSSCMRMGPIAHWFTGNIGYHHIHHLNPKVPFYRLPEVMAAVPALQNPVWVDFNWKTFFSSLKLKFWDEEKCQMVGYADLPQGAHS